MEQLNNSISPWAERSEKQGELKAVHWQDEDNKASIANKLMAVEQELTMQRRQRRKSQAFYKRLTEPGNKQPKGQFTACYLKKKLKKMDRWWTNTTVYICRNWWL